MRPLQPGLEVDVAHYNTAQGSTTTPTVGLPHRTHGAASAWPEVDVVHHNTAPWVNNNNTNNWPTS